MSVKYRLVGIIGLALFCAFTVFGLSTTSALAATTPLAGGNRGPVPPTPPVNHRKNPTPPPTHHPSPPNRSCPANVAPGDRGPAVRQLQIDLNNNGFTGPRGKSIPVNGYYDGITLSAVRHFEAQNNFPQNGRIDARQWHQLGECR
jgi:peptidoglycan hydrolase-like protein with peptidoglycan-binding domain